jgi:nucleotide-binding universal stress UspA family protein
LYKKIVAALDGSPVSNFALDAAVDIVSRSEKCHLIGCHVYASRLHRTRFEEMETGLPDQYQEEKRLNSLRETHEDLISEGMQLISDAYLAPLAKKAKELELSYEEATPEGHHYVKLLQLMQEQEVDLTILGAYGHGYVPEESLGSLTERLLLYGNTGDLLVMRQPWVFKNRPILVGIDGSPNSYQALKRAVEIGILMGAKIEAVAVYDPFFHSTVFKTIAESLPIEAAKRFNFTAQEKLHDEIIDRGLETLYRDSLLRGSFLAKEMGVEIKTDVLAGKVYPQIHHHAALRNAALIVVGKYGLHQETESKIGSNAHKLARLTPNNLLVVNSTKNETKIPEIPDENEYAHLPWDPEAEKIAERIPFFVRKMAIKSIEERARAQGLDHVTGDLVMQASGKMKRPK